MEFKWILISVVSLIVILIGVLAYIYTSMEKATVNLYPDLIREVLNGAKPSLSISVTGFNNNTRIPSNYTCDGADISPEIIVSNIPIGTKYLAILVYDIDAPRGVFYHWLIYNIRVNDREVIIRPGIEQEIRTSIGVQAINDFGKPGYNGPCPPPGHGIHRYVFIVFALDKEISASGKIVDVVKEFKDHVVAYGVYIGLYER
ncbi:MAG: YbhB/YbcL family Raf kinase inhibitor-like protein [Thermoprotei archaeon]